MTSIPCCTQNVKATQQRANWQGLTIHSQEQVSETLAYINFTAVRETAQFLSEEF
jgi:uncharacterized protein YchJ